MDEKTLDAVVELIREHIAKTKWASDANVLKMLLRDIRKLQVDPPA